ncbi:hypothetical protein [Sinorhizobium sp. A49]|uniref:hypothetical protein n=1 Tax=Sinorhizobium sp. A49 TaxID=1945861 RepID=UPI0015C529E3|nr:hypothetical protein [Sinorhizobium sp. A49]
MKPPLRDKKTASFPGRSSGRKNLICIDIHTVAARPASENLPFRQARKVMNVTETPQDMVAGTRRESLVVPQPKPPFVASLPFKRL